MSDSIHEVVYNPRKTFLVTFNRMSMLFIHPPLSIPATKADQIGIIASIDQDIIRLRISPDSPMRM